VRPQQLERVQVAAPVGEQGRGALIPGGVVVARAGRHEEHVKHAQRKGRGGYSEQPPLKAAKPRHQVGRRRSHARWVIATEASTTIGTSAAARKRVVP
jgi:hypothetical protein